MSLADAVGSIYGDDLRDTIANAIGPARHLALKHHRPGDLFPPLSYTEEDVRAKVPIVFQQGMPRSGPNQPQIPMIGSGSGKGDMIWPLGYADYDPTMPVYVGTRRPPHRPLTRPEADTTMHEIRHRALQQGPGRLTSWTQSATQNPYYAGAAGSGLAKMSAAAERAEQMEQTAVDRYLLGVPVSGSESMRRGRGWIYDPAEMDVRLAQMKELYKGFTGKNVYNERDAQQMWDWWKESAKYPSIQRRSVLSPEEMGEWERDPYWNEPDPNRPGSSTYRQQFMRRLPQLMQTGPSGRDMQGFV